MKAILAIRGRVDAASAKGREVTRLGTEWF